MLPEIAVVVPSHERPLRLRSLLDSLEAQTLDAERWELVVVFDDAGDASATLLAEHPLAKTGRLRVVRLAPGMGTASRKRNVGWRRARASLIVFTDDDCRAEPSWLEELLAVACSQRARTILQGATRPDPYEAGAIDLTPCVRTLRVDPPSPYAQTCNIAYPRAMLESLAGFDETFLTAGEDTDLFMRARAAGAIYVGVPRAIVNHAVETYSLAAMVRLSWKWQQLPYVVRRHPQVRSNFKLGVFWRPTHAALTSALLLSPWVRGRRLKGLLFMPYLSMHLASARAPRRWSRGVVELPSRVVIDLAEFLALVSGSLRYRTLFL